MRVLPGTWLAVAAAVAFGGVGVFAKLAFHEGWDLSSLLATRFLIAAVVLLPFALHAGGGWRGLPSALLLGAFGYVAMTALYFSSFRLLPVAASAFMLYLAPALVALYTWLVHGTMKTSWLGGLLASTIGLALMSGGALLGSLSPIGLLLAGGSTIVYAGLFIIGKRILRFLHPARAVLAICTGAFAGYATIALAQGTLFTARSPTAWSLVIGLGIVSTAVALLLFYAALSRAPSTQVAIVSTLEPIATLLIAFILLQEALPATGLLGGLFILAGAALVAIDPHEPLQASAQPVAK